MLVSVALMAENLSSWISFNMPVDHAFDPGGLLLPSNLFDPRSAGGALKRNPVHDSKYIMDRMTYQFDKIICRILTSILQHTVIEAERE